MGNLRILASGIRLEGTAEFLGPLYARNISADQVQSNDNKQCASEHCTGGLCAKLLPIPKLIGLDPAASVTDINQSQRWRWWL